MHPPAEQNIPPCPTHGAPPRALHSHNFRGIIEVCEEILDTISGVGTTSFSRCPYGYDASFAGVVRVLEDLNTSISGIQGGGDTGLSGLAPGSGIYFTSSGGYTVINADYGVITSGSLVAGNNVSFIYAPDGQLVINTAPVLSGGAVVVNVQDTEPPGINGTLWYDTNQGRMFVYASGAEEGWYQTNADALAVKGAYPPSGAGLNSPARDGLLWYNTSIGSLLIYDANTSGWYETAPGVKGAEYSTGAPIPEKEGDLWYSATESTLKIWNGSTWESV